MDIKLPRLGEGADSGSVVSILVKEGDRVAAGQPLIELENEKAVVPIPAPVAGGVTSLRVRLGDRIAVGQVILVLATGDEPAQSKPELAPSPPPSNPSRPGPATTALAAAAGPLVLPESEPEAPSGLPPAAPPTIRRLARELGIDLRSVRGNEAGGRMGMGDLRGYIQNLQRAAAQGRAAAAAHPTAKAAPASPDFSQWGPVVKKPLSPLRKTIVQRLTASWTAIPHVHQFDEADITALDELRRRYAPVFERQGVRLTLTSFVLVALVQALKKHPVFNASLDERDQTVVLKNYFNIGVAVDTEAGLIVPVVRHVDQKSLLELSRDVSEMAQKARERKVTLEDLKGGTFTLSNQGGIGGGAFTPIINQPEAAILGLGRSLLKPVIRAGQVEPRLMLPLCVGYDHRLVDGGEAARFVVDLAAALSAFPEAQLKGME
jgi:pyruvate dehydrogenase E2 component (dihydrolipoamide acetyltransferase)